MGLFDKLRGRDKPAAAPSSGGDDLEAWLGGVMARLEPERIQFRPGETLGDVFARVLSEEEQAVRAATSDPLQEKKLRALAMLRERFPTDDAPKEATMTGTAPTGKSGYELVLGGQEELGGAPLALMLQLVSGWQTVVAMIGQQQRLPESQLAEYITVKLRIEEGPRGEELVAIFIGTKEMVDLYKSKMKEAGLDPGA